MNGNGNSFMDYLNSFTQTAGRVYSTLNPPEAPTVVQAAAPAAPAQTNWMPWAIGAGVLLLLVAVVSMFGGRR